MHLARDLGFPSVRAMRRAMTAQDLCDWEALYAVDPWGEERADLRNGIACTQIVAPHLRSGATPPKPLDFMPFADRTPQQMSVADMKAELERFLG